MQRRSVQRPPGQPIAELLPGARVGIGILDGAEQQRDGHVGERLDGRVDQGPQVVAVAPGRGQARVVGRVEVEPASLAGPGIEQDVAERRVAVAQAFAPPVGTRQLDPMQVPQRPARGAQAPQPGRRRVEPAPRVIGEHHPRPSGKDQPAPGAGLQLDPVERAMQRTLPGPPLRPGQDPHPRPQQAQVQVAGPDQQRAEPTSPLRDRRRPARGLAGLDRVQPELAQPGSEPRRPPPEARPGPFAVGGRPQHGPTPSLLQSPGVESRGACRTWSG